MKTLPFKNTGIEFEKIVAGIQAQVDPNAEVSHNEQIIDKLGNSRQFDVVIRGQFAGQELLGVIECKDLNKKVGTPELDAFVTKAKNINANFKVVVSRKGFTKPALKEAKYYGIQTLSLIPNDKDHGFKVGSYWYADIYYWEKLSLTLLFVTDPENPIEIDPKQVKINNKRVLDWFTNYLFFNHDRETREGWVVEAGIRFNTNQLVQVSANEKVECTGLFFSAKRTLARKQKFVGINGVGFFDWQKSKVTFPAKTSVESDAVQTDFMDWENRTKDEFDEGGFINIKIIGHNGQLDKIENVIDLESL